MGRSRQPHCSVTYLGCVCELSGLRRGVTDLRACFVVEQLEVGGAGSPRSRLPSRHHLKHQRPDAEDVGGRQSGAAVGRPVVQERRLQVSQSARRSHRMISQPDRVSHMDTSPSLSPSLADYHTQTVHPARPAVTYRQLSQPAYQPQMHGAFRRAIFSLYGTESAPKFNSVGCKVGNILHTRLRLNASTLNPNLFQIQIASSPCCDCGSPKETVAHLVLNCPHFNMLRSELFRQISYNKIPTSKQLNEA